MKNLAKSSIFIIYHCNYVTVAAKLMKYTLMLVPNVFNKLKVHLMIYRKILFKFRY
jgi:hypothetical protein